MRRLWLFGLLLAIGCTRSTTVTVVAPDVPVAKAPEGPPTPAFVPVPLPELSPQEKYDAALWNALTLAADNKLPDAIAALETARAAVDNEQVRTEIAKLRARLDGKTAAERVAADITTVLNDGKPEEAAKLAANALSAYGDSETSEIIVRLKRQADALLTARLDETTRLTRFRQEAEAAEKAKDLRAAMLAYEQAVAAGGEEDLRRKLDTHKKWLAKYEDARRRAAEFRRDPEKLEDAITALREAETVWDTPIVRQELDDCTLALQTRRDRLAVADFETRGDVGVPAAGRAVAEELLPAFRSRYDVVERAQLGKVFDEMKLSAADVAASDSARADFARLARVRYLVIGSITPLGGVTINARLVDAKTGLIVQTAKVVAPTVEAAVALMPSLAAMLQMTDEQRQVYETKTIALAPPSAVVVVPEGLAFPTAADLQPTNPPPIVVYTARPADVGGCAAADFAALPPPGTTVVANVRIAKDNRFRPRALSLAIELGDNLFRRGRHREANDQYQIAAAFSDGNSDVALRVERCRPFLPPTPVVVRPRVAVLDFVPLDGALLPPGVGALAAGQLGPYLSLPYDPIDRGEVCWYAGRLGLTLKDVVVDPSARACLGRALNTRYVVVGTLRGGPGGIDARAHLLDAETGLQLGTSEIHAADPHDLKCRLPDLARWLLLDAPERDRLRREADEERTVLARASQESGSNLTLAMNLIGDLGKRRPNSVSVQVLYQQLDRRSQQATFDAQRRREAEAQAAAVAEAQRRQAELAQAAEAARIDAVRQANAIVESERQRQREAAYTQLLTQARSARSAQNYSQAAQLFDSALGIQRRDDVFREAAAARSLAEEAARLKAADEVAIRERQLRQQREAELARTRAQYDNERRRRDAEEQVRRRVQDQHDQKEYVRLKMQAEQLTKAGNHDGAVVALQSAKHLRPSDESDRLLTTALVSQARAAAEKKGETARKELEAKLAVEKAARDKAETELRRNQELYQTAIAAAQAAMAKKNYDTAIAQYQTASKLFKSDAVLNGMKQAQDARDAEKSRAEADAKRQAEERQRQTEVARLVASAQTALTNGEPDKAINAYKLALAVQPGNVNALAGKAKAEQTKFDAVVAARAKAEAKAKGDAEAKAKVAEAKAKVLAAQAESERLKREAQAKSDDAAKAERERTDREAKAKADADAKARAAAAKAERERMDRDAKAKADADAKLRVDAAAKAEKERIDRDAKAKADADAKLRADAAAKAEKERIDRDAKAKADADAKARVDAAAKAERERMDREAKAKADADAAAKTERDRKDREAKAKADADSKLRADAAAKAEKERIDREAKAKADADAKARADAAAKAERDRKDREAKAKADADAKLRADATAKAEKERIDREVKAKADADAKARADAAAKAERDRKDREAKAKADADAAAKAERDRKDREVKAKADADAKTRADAAAKAERERTEREAKAKADAEAKAKATPPPLPKAKAPPPPPPEYTRQMDAAVLYLKQERYADAKKAYENALKVLPTDADATKRFEYAKRMEAGTTALKANKKPDAIREFEAALKALPKDDAATKALDQAKR